VIVQGGFAGAAVQLKLIALEEDAVAVRPVGPVGGTESHPVEAEVSALACAEGAEAPYKSTASTE
jgi:hypothetical protein